MSWLLQKENLKGNYHNSDNVITVCSPGLSKHICWSTNQECFEKYSSLNLVDGVKIDLTTSLKYPIPANQSKKSTTSFTSSQLGLTLTANGLCNQVTSSNRATNCDNLHSVLNQQVSCNAFHPHLPCSLIQSILSNPTSNSSVNPSDGLSVDNLQNHDSANENDQSYNLEDDNTNISLPTGDHQKNV